MLWHEWNKTKPQIGEKIVIVCNDGCSSSLAFMTDDGLLDAEDAYDLGVDFTRGAIWTPLPPDYPIACMERHDDY